MTASERVWKQMIQMFGPQWIEKWGKSNEVWDAALKELSYAQVTHGLKQVLQGKLKYYEIDLPNFLTLCRPTAPTEAAKPVQSAQLGWQRGMSKEEIDLHCTVNMVMLSWRREQTVDVTTEQAQAMWKSARRIAHDFFEMRQELGREKVPDSDLLKALERQWAKDLALGVST